MSNKHNLRTKVHEIIFEADTQEGKFFDIVLLWLIVISVIMVILESVESYNAKYHDFFFTVEWILTIAFSIEYFLRIYSLKKPKYYIFSFYGVVDFLSILPTYLSLVIVGTHTLAIIRILRLFRIFRIFKLSRYVAESSTLMIALKASRRKIFVFMASVVLLVIVLGAIMYLIEGGANETFDSIPRGVYWAIVTLTTVGYGDISPSTPLGQFVASIVMILGYAIIAVPTGIVTAELSNPSLHRKNNTQSCGNCNFHEHEDDAKFCKRCGESLHI